MEKHETSTEEQRCLGSTGAPCYAIISRLEAQKQGLSLYFTGKPCIHGHISERWCCDQRCKECGRIKRKKHYKANAKNEKDARKMYYRANREPIALAKAKNRARNNETDCALHQKIRDVLGDNYIKEKLRRKFGITTDQITPQMITAKRNELLQYRLFKEINNGIN